MMLFSCNENCTSIYHQAGGTSSLELIVTNISKFIGTTSRRACTVSSGSAKAALIKEAPTIPPL